MSNYRLTIKCNDTQIEVAAKNGVVLAHELDRYLESFTGFQPKVKPEIEEEKKTEEVKEFFPKIEKTQPVQEPSRTQEMPEVEHNSSQELITLADFLISNDSTSLFDEFIVSAYYIKKVLNKNSFTIKFLNSKFYPAANRLIDFAVIEEAKNRGFVNVWEEEDGTKFSLNEQGETYFINQLNR